jgi:hypothetical protein
MNSIGYGQENSLCSGPPLHLPFSVIPSCVRPSCQALELTPLASHARITLILLHEDTNILRKEAFAICQMPTLQNKDGNKRRQWSKLSSSRCLLPRHVADKHPVAVAVLVHHGVLPRTVPVHEPCA